MGSEQCGVAAARIECCFVFYSCQDQTQTTLLLYIGRRQRVNRHGEVGVREMDGESSDGRRRGPWFHSGKIQR